MYQYPTQTHVASRLEWHPNIERLRTEIEDARRTGNFEHLAIAEAECWLDLIDAELSARGSFDDIEIQQLKSWRSEIETLLKPESQASDAVAEPRR